MTKTLKWLGGGIAAAMLLGLAGLFSGEVAEAQPTGPPHRFAGSVTVDGEPAAAGTSVTAVVNGAECGSATVLTGSAGSTYALDVPDSCADAGDAVSFRVGGYDAAEHGEWSGGGRTDLDLTATAAMPEDPMDDPMEECPDDMSDDMSDDMADDMGDDEPAEPGDDMSDDMGDDMSDDMGDDMADDCPEEDDMGTDEPAEPDTDDPAEPDTDDPMDGEMDDPMDGEEEMAPEGPDTGTGLATTSTSTSLAALLGVTALAIVLGGYTVARRRR